MRYERTMAIAKRHEALLALIGHGSFSCPDIAKELGVSLPTISRDIVFLRRQGYGIKSVRGSNCWAYELTGTPESRQLLRRKT